MSRLIRFISARWTRRGRGGHAQAASGGAGRDEAVSSGTGVPCVSSASTKTINERLCCRVSLLDGTDLILDLPVSNTPRTSAGSFCAGC